MESKFKIGDIVYFLGENAIIHNTKVVGVTNKNTSFVYKTMNSMFVADEPPRIIYDTGGPSWAGHTILSYNTFLEEELYATEEEAKKAQQEKSPLKGVDVSKLKEQFECSSNPTKLGTSLYS